MLVNPFNPINLPSFLFGCTKNTEVIAFQQEKIDLSWATFGYILESWSLTHTAMNNNFFAEEKHLQVPTRRNSPGSYCIYQAVIYIFWRVKGRLTGDIFFQRSWGFLKILGIFMGLSTKTSPQWTIYITWVCLRFLDILKSTVIHNWPQKIPLGVYSMHHFQTHQHFRAPSLLFFCVSEFVRHSGSQRPYVPNSKLQHAIGPYGVWLWESEKLWFWCVTLKNITCLSPCISHYYILLSCYYLFHSFPKLFAYYWRLIFIFPFFLICSLLFFSAA